MKKTPESTSLREAAQATDSTWTGCSAKIAATAALSQSLCVKRSSAKKSSTQASACKARLPSR
jgi:hypothetical protein